MTYEEKEAALVLLETLKAQLQDPEYQLIFIQNPLFLKSIQHSISRLEKMLGFS
jgi:hypothetical protein